MIFKFFKVKFNDKRDKVVRITIENVEAPNMKVSSLKDVKNALVKNKQVLLLKANDNRLSQKQDGIEEAKLKAEQRRLDGEQNKLNEARKKKQIEKNIINRLNRLLKRVKDIKQKHFQEPTHKSRKIFSWSIAPFFMLLSWYTFVELFCAFLFCS